MRSTPDDYQKRTMEELADAALEILREQPGLRCGTLGERLFPMATLRGSAPFARLAGRVVRLLEKQGKATHLYNPSTGLGGWYAK